MKDDYEIDWDSNDMFDGDVDFDMEFDLDPNAKKSFIGGFASGFLTGITDNTIGTTDAKIKTLRTVLPSTWSNALDKADFLNQRYQALEKEFQENNAQTAKSLQNIAGRLSEKMSDKMPSFLTDGINKFSEKDFSDWEKIEPGTERLGGMDDADDDSIEYAQDRALNSESSMFSALGDSLNSMTAAATASLQSTMMSGNRQLINIELRQSQPVEVTPKEFALLTRLIMRSGQTVHRETLQQDIYSWQDDPGSNTLEVHIHNLRRKLGKDRIKTVRGVGYRLESQK